METLLLDPEGRTHPLTPPPASLAQRAHQPGTIARGAATQEPLQFCAVRDLPPLPAAVLELLEVLQREDIDTGVLAAKISLDQALTAKTLRLANSSFYGMPRHVTSVAEAMVVLGLRTVRTVVTAAAVTGSFRVPACEGFDFAAFWRHAAGCAVGAKLVANALGEDAEAAFTAGLLLDIGELVLADSFPERYAAVLAYRATRGGAVALEAERELLGTDHAAIGATVGRHWCFPEQIVHAIGGHHDLPGRADSLTLCHVVHAAELLVDAIERGVQPGLELPIPYKQAWLATGLSAECWVPTFAEADLQTRAVCAALFD